MKKIYTMGQSDHSKTWNPSTLTWYYLCLSALNRNKVCKLPFSYTNPPPSFRCAKIGVIFFIILGCSLNELVTKGASGKFFFQRTTSKNWGGRNCLSGAFQSLYRNKSNFLYENCFKNMSWKNFHMLESKWTLSTSNPDTCILSKMS